jgi:hypothetical protein
MLLFCLIYTSVSPCHVTLFSVVSEIYFYLEKFHTFLFVLLFCLNNLWITLNLVFVFFGWFVYLISQVLVDYILWKLENNDFSNLSWKLQDRTFSYTFHIGVLNYLVDSKRQWGREPLQVVGKDDISLTCTLHFLTLEDLWVLRQCAWLSMASLNKCVVPAPYSTSICILMWI